MSPIEPGRPSVGAPFERATQGSRLGSRSATSAGMNSSEQSKRLATLQRLVGKYERAEHERQFLPDGHPRYSWFRQLAFLRSERWKEPSRLTTSPPSAAIHAPLLALEVCHLACHPGHLIRRHATRRRGLWPSTSAAAGVALGHQIPDEKRCVRALRCAACGVFAGARTGNFSRFWRLPGSVQ